ncbi:hypothetical protein B0T26DRAFT_756423 [Lasiosphaeria miniovina]|uniref:Uncharacterized protein n=1 Tax=Lasiosphaeria miniovina TaxID=1954250 RepID=A0AA40A0F6_9PEZI|nr:uncharacterized protein B0T26DRAFT_756423 [Lasiosphaeria miniovina]KAK0707021.1 hypothetical protein B0T26DRAFT_756423 [Lasiosphaeria miniovina]
MARTSEQEAFAYPRVKARVQAAKEFAPQGIDGGRGLLDWACLNYADPSQDVLASPGEENTPASMRITPAFAV